MKIKRHKIKILSDSFESNFVVDLRSKNKSNKKTIEEKSFNSNISGIENDFNKENFFKYNSKKNYNSDKKKIINIESVKKTFLFPVFLLFYKFLKVIIVFFVVWGRDIAGFLKKVGIFKKISSIPKIR